MHNLYSYKQAGGVSMKNVVMLLVSGSLGILMLLIVMTINSGMNRSVELKSQLPHAMEQTVERMKDSDERYGSGEAVAECIESMAAAIDTDSAMKVEVYGEDLEKGILSLRVSEEFRHPNGMMGKAEAVRTVIYDQKENREKKSCRIYFYRSGEEMQAGKGCYKICVMQEGELVSPPAPPVGEGETFAGWRDAGENPADFSQPVAGDLIYCAAWE